MSGSLKKKTLKYLFILKNIFKVVNYLTKNKPDQLKNYTLTKSVYILFNARRHSTPIVVLIIKFKAQIQKFL